MERRKAMTVEEEQAEARRREDAAEAAVLTSDNYAEFSDGVYDRVRDGDPVMFILLAVIVYVIVEEAYRSSTALACACCTMLGSRLYYRRRLQKTTRRMQAVHNSALQWTPVSPGDRQLDQLDHGEHVDGHPRAETHRRGKTHHHARAPPAKLPWFIAGAAVKEVHLGEEPLASGISRCSARYGRQVCEADIALDTKDMRVVVRLNLRGLGEMFSGKIRRMAGERRRAPTWTSRHLAT